MKCLATFSLFELPRDWTYQQTMFIRRGSEDSVFVCPFKLVLGDQSLLSITRRLDRSILEDSSELPIH